jgi:hypothetical protein
MLPFALSILLGAFLLFQVQPLIGKYILPWFGGSPGVWTTCLLFFQVVLLGGYAYAHLLGSRVPRQRQGWVHLALLGVALCFIPVIPSGAWKPDGAEDPVTGILLLLAATIGVPYLALSATGPLMQHWFSLSQPGRSPYRLYALSNVGSLAALISYPFLFEWLLTRHAQAWLWSAGLVAFTGVCVWCVLTLRRESAPTPRVEGVETTGTPATETGAAPTGGSPVLLWIALPAIASILLIATTNQLSQDIAVIPFLWVLPLALYLLSFILSFDHPRWYRRGLFAALLVVGVTLIHHLLIAEASAALALQLVGYAGGLFVACMICHGELYRVKPEPRRLTAYYLAIAAGGALGGFLVAVVAPRIFDRFAELQIGLWALSYTLGLIALRDRSRSLVFGVLAGLLVALILFPALKVRIDGELLASARRYGTAFVNIYQNYWKEVALGLALLLFCLLDGRGRFTREWRPRLGGVIMLLSVLLGVLFMLQLHRSIGPALVATRNFYGTLRVQQEYSGSPNGHHYKLVHGVITHGLQFRSPSQSLWPTTYYGETSGVGLAIKHLRRPAGERHLALVGLGTGTLAAYGRSGDRLRIYEINPDVERLARSHFTFLAESPAAVEVVLGDARLTMEQELARGEPQGFDLLALDAFSSDAIPIHLLTAEAFGLYLRHLRENGIIAVHISNRFLDLQGVVENIADHHGLKVITITEDDSENWWIYSSKWMLVAREPEALDVEEFLERMRAPSLDADRIPLWTDDHASLFPVLR